MRYTGTCLCESSNSDRCQKGIASKQVEKSELEKDAEMSRNERVSVSVLDRVSVSKDDT
jgi:hypothetical protein